MVRGQDQQPAEVRVVDPDQRLDQVLVNMARVGSRNRARRALESGKVRVDGRPVGLDDAGRRLAPGTLVQIDWNLPGSSLAATRGRHHIAQAGLGILYEDEHVLAIDKPSGLLTDTASVQQARERDSVRKRLLPWLRAHGQRPWIVHRIDRDTTGVVLVARTEVMAERLRRQFRAHTPERVYWAVVEGVPRSREGIWEDPMVWDAARRIQRRSDEPGAFLARAAWRVHEVFAGASLLEVRLHTGRRNQIRLQAQLMGHPLLGERLYRPSDRPDRSRFPRQALHALRLGVVHPATGRPLVVEAPLPTDFHRLLERLRARGSGR